MPDTAPTITKFECLGCGLVSVLENLPPKCPQCGHGTGVLHEESELARKAPRRAADESPRE